MYRAYRCWRKNTKATHHLKPIKKRRVPLYLGRQKANTLKALACTFTTGPMPAKVDKTLADLLKKRREILTVIISNTKYPFPARFGVAVYFQQALQLAF
jgi:hypothetical protein